MGAIVYGAVLFFKAVDNYVHQLHSVAMKEVSWKFIFNHTQ